MIHLETDVPVVGSGGAGMYAAIGAARNGADVILLTNRRSAVVAPP